MALVHITHYNVEAESADRDRAHRARIDARGRHDRDGCPPAVTARSTHRTGPVLEIAGVGHEYGRGTLGRDALRESIS